MFSKLKKKFICRITAIILLIITIPFIVLYASFKFSLENDYTENSEKFHRQIAQTLNRKLSQIEDSVNLYIFKYQLENAFKNSSEQYFSVNDLKNLPNYCPDVSSAFIIDTFGNIKYYNSGDILSDFHRLLSDNSYHSCFFSNTPTWFFADFTEINNAYWICTMPINFENNTPVGYISVLIESQKLNKFFHDINIEYCQNDLFYLYSKRSRELLLPKIQNNAGIKTNARLLESIASGNSAKDGNTTISSYPLSSDSMQLISVSKKDYIAHTMRSLVLPLFGIWCALLPLCFFLSSKITNQFIFDLQKLCSKVKNYTTSKTYQGGSEL